MRVQVIQTDIAYGTPLDCFNCPIARAIKRLWPDFLVEVDSVIDIDGQRFWLDDSVVDFINDFDQGCNVEPFEFELQEIF